MITSQSLWIANQILKIESIKERGNTLSVAENPVAKLRFAIAVVQLSRVIPLLMLEAMSLNKKSNLPLVTGYSILAKSLELVRRNFSEEILSNAF